MLEACAKGAGGKCVHSVEIRVLVTSAQKNLLEERI